jgi:hypothetical protein
MKLNNKYLNVTGNKNISVHILSKIITVTLTVNVTAIPIDSAIHLLCLQPLEKLIVPILRNIKF